MNLLKVEKGVINILSYKDELVKVYPNKISIGNKDILAEPTDCFVCENGLLVKIENAGNLSKRKFYVYDGDSFVRITNRYDSPYSIHHCYSPDVFGFVKYDTVNALFKMAFNNRGAECLFDYKCDVNLFDFFFNQKHEVLIFAHYGHYFFFSKTGKKLWELEHTNNFNTAFNTDGFAPDSDGFILKVMKAGEMFTVCYNVLTGEVMWEHKDNHPYILTGNKCADGVYRNILPYKDSVLFFEMDSSNGDIKAHLLKEGKKAEVFDKNLNDIDEQYFCTCLQGDKIYFTKNYSNCISDDKRERTIGIVDLKAMTVHETKCFSGFCNLSAPILFEDNLYVLKQLASGHMELMCLDQTTVTSELNYDSVQVLDNECASFFENEDEQEMSDAEMSARLEEAENMFNLALTYEKGDGVPVDYEKAEELYSKSAEQGYEPALKYLRKLREKLELECLTGCECMAIEGDAVKKYFEFREQGKKDGFIPVIVSFEELYIGNLKYSLGCEDEESPAKIKEIVKAFHEKMLTIEVEDGKAYLDKNYVDAEWNEAEFNKNKKVEECFSPFMSLYLVKVPVTEPWRIWAYLPYGNWNSCPDVSKHMAVSKYWYEQYGAYPAAISGSCVDYAVEKPVKDCKALVKEMGGYCFDFIEQGFETYSALGACVKKNRIWNFWWD